MSAVAVVVLAPVLGFVAVILVAAAVVVVLVFD